jgi:alcohol dehydrogenase (cytochrome c)
MNRRLKLSSIVLFALGAGVVGGGVTSSRADEFTRIEVGVGDLRGEILSLFAPPGAIATEANPNYKGAASPAPAAPPSPAAADWPSYNKTLTSERFSDLSQINTKKVAKLKVLCTYDTWRLTAFETGLIMVEGAHRHDRVRYFLHRPLDLRRELAHARGISGLHSADQSGSGLPRRQAIPWDLGRARAGL